MTKNFLQIRHLAISLLWFPFRMATLRLSNCKLSKSMAKLTSFDVVGTLYITGNLAFFACEMLILFINVGFLVLATCNGDLNFGSELFPMVCLTISLCGFLQVLRCAFIKSTVIVVYLL